MSSSQDIQTTTAIATEANFSARDVTINMNTTTNYSTAAKKPRLWNSVCTVEAPSPNFTDAEKSKVWKPFCTVTAPTPNFTGREDLIKTIHCRIQQCSKEREYSKKTVVIHGLGGIGKSELVRKYVQMYRQDIINAAWINAESKNSLEGSFMSLAKKLNLQTKDNEFEDIVYSIYENLSDHNQPSLFIFDNAEQMRSDDNVFGIFEFLPTVQLHSIPLIIITTRFKDWEIPEENILQINELSEEAAVKFLTERWRLSAEQKGDGKIMDALKDLAQNLQCFPLGLTLAASNIPISKLRSIPKEIKDYIQKINSPHEGWILERQSAGTASKYDLIMNNVWEATLEKIKSQGEDGEAAISLLNLIAYFPPDCITVQDVVEVVEFSGPLNSTVGIEMLELYSLISLPSSTDIISDSDVEVLDIARDDLLSHQFICIHRLVQRCTRDKLDREKNYTHLLKLSWILADQKDYYVDKQAIHNHLKERMWPENSIHFSIIFACWEEEWMESKWELIKDVNEVFALDEKPSHLQNLPEDYKILHALNLFRVSINTCYSHYLNLSADWILKYSSYIKTYNDLEQKKLWEDLILKYPSYSTKYLEQVFVSCMGICVKGLFMGTIDKENLVQRAILRVLFDILDAANLPTLSADAQEETPLIIAEATCNSFKGSVETVGQLYWLLWKICLLCKRTSCSWCVEMGLKIHGSVYASIKETGGSRLDSYWEEDLPIPYEDIQFDLEYKSDAEWNRSFVESLCTEAGLQFLLQHLQYADALTQTKKDFLPKNLKYLYEFITFLGWKWKCTKEFVQANLFMETLYSVTKNLFKLNADGFRENQFRCLIAWFGIFGENTFVDCKGVSWSIQSVEIEMILFLDIADILMADCSTSYWNSEDVLYEFIESSGSDQDSIAVKTAKQMQNWLKTINHPPFNFCL